MNKVHIIGCSHSSGVLHADKNRDNSGRRNVRPNHLQGWVYQLSQRYQNVEFYNWSIPASGYDIQKFIIEAILWDDHIDDLIILQSTTPRKIFGVPYGLDKGPKDVFKNYYYFDFNTSIKNYSWSCLKLEKYEPNAELAWMHMGPHLLGLTDEDIRSKIDFENEYDKHIAWYEDIETIYRNHFKKFIHVPWYRIKSRDFDLNVPEWVNKQYRHDYNCTTEEAITYMNMEGEPHGNHLSEHRQEQLLNGYILKNENLYNWLQQ